MSMSATRAFTSQRAAAHLVEARRLEAVFGRGPAHDRVEPDVGELLAVPHPCLAAVVGVDDAGFVVGEAPREAAGERVGWFDHVIVDGDDRVRARSRFGFRQPGDLLAPPLAAAERLTAREIVQRHVHAATTSGPRSPVWRIDPGLRAASGLHVRTSGSRRSRGGRRRPSTRAACSGAASTSARPR